jgi:hypothetical protein
VSNNFRRSNSCRFRFVVSVVARVVTDVKKWKGTYKKLNYPVYWDWPTGIGPNHIGLGLFLGTTYYVPYYSVFHITKLSRKCFE